MFGSQGWPEVYGTERVPRALSEQLMDAWLAFAKTGDPNHGNMADWPAYDTSERATMIFNTTDASPISEVVSDPAADERAFWDSVPFDGITPTSKPEDL